MACKTKRKITRHVPPDVNMQYHLQSILTKKIKSKFDQASTANYWGQKEM